MNFYVGLVSFEPYELTELDTKIRKILRVNRIHHQAANTERLYLPRSELGRGLTNTSDKGERILLAMYDFLDKRKETCLRKAAILDIEKKKGTQLGIIREYLKSKYNVESGELTKKVLIEKQKEKLYKKINVKYLHSILFQARNSPHADVSNSSIWLKNGNNTPQQEGLSCYFQDRNVFFEQNRGICPHCKKNKKSVDHLATRCDRMLAHDYTRRHNEVLKCLHLTACRTFGFTRNKKLKTHSVSSLLDNDRARIIVDSPILTDTQIRCNKPDMVIFDKVLNLITIVEVGITSQDCLQTVEVEKLRKYDLLANELGLIHKCKTRIIPYVLTWDGIVTKCHKRYRQAFGVEKFIEAYIQSLVLKKTYESILTDFKRGNMLGSMSRNEMIEISVDKLFADGESNDEEIGGVRKIAEVLPDVEGRKRRKI